MATYSSSENRLLQKIVQPSGQTIEELAQTQVFYSRVQAQATQTLQSNMGRTLELLRTVFDPLTNPPERIPTKGAKGHTVYMFGSTRNNDLRLDELKAALSSYREFLSSDADGTVENAYWRSSYAMTASVLIQIYFVEPINSIRGAFNVFKKRFTDLERQMLQQAFGSLGSSGGLEAFSTLQEQRPGPLSASGNQQLLIRVSSEKALAIVSDVMALGEKRFKLVELEHQQADGDSPLMWRVVSIDLADKLFKVTVDDDSDTLEVDRDGLVDLLCASEMFV
ncbi:hypothetical protein GYMLUDRAFT_67808 [Collybiopsis luxurians FD-317 M1]|nr:hypothetical protein GYMLUDRAFT_67808 [Collybiopsis luxurians FD-317 M1]